LDTLATSDPLFVRFYFHTVHAKLSNVERWINFNSVFKEIATTDTWRLWLEQEAKRTKGQINWHERILNIFKAWWTLH